MAFNSNTLSYDPREPAFIQRLRREAGNKRSDHSQVVNSSQRRVKSHDEEDGPTYVIEEGSEAMETLLHVEQESSQILSTKVDGCADSGHPKSAQSSDSAKVPIPDTPQKPVMAMGFSKKRKAARTIRADDEPPNESIASNPRMKPSKAKKNKLSFAEDVETA